SPHGVKSQNTPLCAVTCHRACGADARSGQASAARMHRPIRTTKVSRQHNRAGPCAPSPAGKGWVGRKRNRLLLAAPPATASAERPSLTGRFPLRRHSRARGSVARGTKPLILTLSRGEGRRRPPPTQSRKREKRHMANKVA